MKNNQEKFIFCWVLLVLLTSGCGSSKVQISKENTNTKSSGLRVVTTFLPMYWFTKAVTGDKAQVDILIPPGTEVHEYQATPGNVQAIAKADILIKNGLGLEEFLSATIQNAGNSKLKQINASQGIKPLEEISLVNNSNQSSQEKQGNPHVWLNPILAKQEVENIRDGLIAADPQHRNTYQQNAAIYIQKLVELDQQFQKRLQPYQGCKYITFHDAYPYLAQRYQLQQIAVVHIPEDNLLPADVQKTVATVKQFKIKTLLSEPGVDNKLLQSLSKDLNLTVHKLNSLESGSLDPNYYFMAMKKNLQTLETACK